MSALGATIKKRREELQEVTHTNAVEMDSIKTKAADAVAKAKEDHEKKVCKTDAYFFLLLVKSRLYHCTRNGYGAFCCRGQVHSFESGGFTENRHILDTFVCLTAIYTLATPTQTVETFH